MSEFGHWDALDSLKYGDESEAIRRLLADPVFDAYVGKRAPRKSVPPVQVWINPKSQAAARTGMGT